MRRTLLAAVLCLGWAWPPWTGAAAAQAERIWPSPPAPARVRFVRSLDPSAARGKPSMFSRVIRAVVGAGDQPVMSQPYGMAVGPDGRLYVADSAAGVVHVFGLDKPGYRSIRVDAESLIGIAFAGPRMILTDSTRARVLCLDLAGHTVWSLGPREGFVRPTGVVATPDRVFVVDTLAHRVVGVSLTGSVLPGFGRRGIGPGELNYPTSIAADRLGRLYVTDAMNFRVQVFDGGGRFVRAFGQLGDGAADFDKPKGIAVDGQGLVYVVEGFHDVVKIFDGEGRVLLVFGGSGGGPGEFWLPAGITLSGTAVYVADTANRRVQVFERLGVAP